MVACHSFVSATAAATFPEICNCSSTPFVVAFGGSVDTPLLNDTSPLIFTDSTTSEFSGLRDFMGRSLSRPGAALRFVDELGDGLREVEPFWFMLTAEGRQDDI